ncbi:MAG: hypothetical protein IPJ69_05395 [Deltaproteobacteria bacterium]|nr:MAG: hypothetical protein IPJ69_05395 [Deltaproteobacteria bacterium]
MDLNHRIIHIEDDQPKRLLCLTCKTERAYRAPKIKKEGSAKVKRAPSKSSVAARKQTEKNLHDQWTQKLSASQRKPKNYRVDGDYALEDILSHPTFGNGIITHLVFPDKIEVFFGEDIKLLKCGKFAQK